MAGRSVWRPEELQRALRRVSANGGTAHGQGDHGDAARALGDAASSVGRRSGTTAGSGMESRFVAYLEWGSRLALENSQPGAKLPMHMPVPRWWWVCDATRGSRVSALAPPPDEAEPRLPDPAARVTFESHVRPLFRQKDHERRSRTRVS